MNSEEAQAKINQVISLLKSLSYVNSNEIDEAIYNLRDVNDYIDETADYILELTERR